MKKLVLFFIICSICKVSFAQIYAISGTFSVCVGDTTALSDIVPLGTWSSSNTAIATVGSTGVVTGVAAGIDTIYYNTGSFGIVNQSVTVNPLPGPILALSSAGTIGITVCQGNTISLHDTSSGGTWSTSNTAIATIGSAGLTTVLTGVSPGTISITYTLPTGCSVSRAATVNALPVIAGSTSVCAGATTILSGTPSGGSWLSGTVSVATVGASSGIVTGVMAGVANISYTHLGCRSTIIVTVIPVPGPISGTSSICAGSSFIFADGTPGGTWTSGNPSVASVDAATGNVTGLSTGTADITYTVGSGCFVFLTMAVIPVSAPAPVSGPTSVCAGSTITLTDASTGGTWSSSPAAIATIGTGTGILMGVDPGVDTVTYSLGVGCGTATASITVNPLPAPILGSAIGSTVCAGNTVPLTDAAGGGTWSSSNPSAATVGAATGVVTTVSPGTAIITYMLATGCSVTTAIVVVAGPAPVTGPGSLCAGTAITLTDVTTGGTWSSSNPGIATPGLATGIVTGITTGTATITYTSGGCIVTFNVTVNPPCPTGINETSISNVEVFPNPAFDELTIKSNPDEYNSFEITNEPGQVVLRSPLRSAKTIVDIKALPSGLYYIIVKGAGGSKTQKFVKM